ncbi:YqeB family protein, partial [Virgisporangium ochraceum]|uniref:YqeB family protein n=1 Tax=Virgisporangium ochraceum TaxID=65505 RepID=UPI001943C7AD
MEATVVREPAWVRYGLWIVFPLIGGVLGWFLPGLSQWVVDLPDFPGKGPFRLVASFPRGPATLVAAGVGVVAGLLLALVAAYERLTVTVAREQVTLTRGDRTSIVLRDRVWGAFADGKQLVIVDRHGGEAAREKHDLRHDAVAAALRAHGYPWLDRDPFADRYQLWVVGVPGLPPGGEALLAARGTALEKSKTEDAERLRRELARVGVVVRDEKKAQYWRLAEPL